MTKILAANIISGLSLICLIVFGVSYLNFKNSPIYRDYKIEIINNPITKNKNIEFSMTGTKILDCQASNVYGIAIRRDGYTVKLDQFIEMYTHNITPGVNVFNTWTLKNVDELLPGIYRVTMVSNWSCTYWIFKEDTTRSHDSILLIVE